MPKFLSVNVSLEGKCDLCDEELIIDGRPADFMIVTHCESRDSRHLNFSVTSYHLHCKEKVIA